MVSIESILSDQHVELKFKNGMVEYFSFSTQHGTANTLQEAIANIIEADKKYDGRVPLAYLMTCRDSR